MKIITTKIASTLLGLSIVFSACQNVDTIIPSNKVTIQEEHFENYNGIEVSTAFTVDVSFSDTEEIIEIEANENLHQYIEVEKINDVLRIRLKNGTSVRGNSTLKAHITTKNYLETYAASGAARITVMDSIKVDDVTISLSEASSFSGVIVSRYIYAFLDGASIASLQGSANTLNANISGASLINNFQMIVDNVDINLSGASQASLTVNNLIDLTASGASSFMYQGTALINHLDLSGASQIIKMD